MHEIRVASLASKREALEVLLGPPCRAQAASPKAYASIGVFDGFGTASLLPELASERLRRTQRSPPASSEPFHYSLASLSVFHARFINSRRISSVLGRLQSKGSCPTG